MPNIEQAAHRLLKYKEDDLVFSPKLPTDTLLNDYEKRLGLCFHPDFRYFIKKVGYASCNGLSNLTLGEPLLDDLLEYSQYAREIGVPYDWLPIMHDNGDYFCLKPDGTVVFWSHNGAVDEQWDNLAAWIEDVWIGGN